MGNFIKTPPLCYASDLNQTILSILGSWTGPNS